MNIEQPGQTKHCKAMIFAPLGHGKTRFCGTAQLDERTSPSLFLDFEGGEQTLAGLGIDMVRIRTREDFNSVYREIASGTKYKSICIDSISEVEFADLMEIIDLAKSGRQPKEYDLIEQGDYGKSHVRLQRLVRQFRDLPYHIFITAGAQDAKEARVGMVKKPALTGKMADQIPAIVDVVGYIALTLNDEGEQVRSLLLQNRPEFRVKIRTAWDVKDTPDEIVEPTVGKLLDVLHIGVEASTKRPSDALKKVS